MGQAAVPLAIAGGTAAAGALSSSKAGSSQASLPRGFSRASGPFGSLIGNIVRDPRFAGGPPGTEYPGGGGVEGGSIPGPLGVILGRSDASRHGPTHVGGLIGDALDFYSTLGTNPDIKAGLDVFRADAADPMRLTDPLFLQERERLSGTLDEEARKRGGLYSTGAQDLVGRGVSDFTNRYLTDAYTRREGAAQGLIGQLLSLGRERFTPFQMLASAIPGLGGATVVPPAQFSNAKGQGAETAGTILGPWLAKRYGTPAAA